MTPKISITILFSVLGFYVIEYFVSRKVKSLQEQYIKQLRQTHQTELQEVQDKLVLANSEIEVQKNTANRYQKKLSELRQFAQDQHEAFVRLNEIYKGIDGSETKQLRSVESLTSDDAIVCNDEIELNAVLKKFEEAGKVWAFDGDKPTKWKPQDGWAFPECISMNRHLREIYRSSIYRRNRIPASDFVQIEPTVIDGIDWSKPVPFPEDYKVPKGVEVVVVSESRENDSSSCRPIGIKGVTLETDDVPYCDFEDGRRMIAMRSHELAPINPTDHPNHPQFKG